MQLVLVELQLGQRLELHRALHLLELVPLVLVDLLLQAQLRLVQLVLALLQLELLPVQHQALHLALLAHLDQALQPVLHPHSRWVKRQELHQFVIALLDHLH